MPMVTRTATTTTKDFLIAVSSLWKGRVGQQRRGSQCGQQFPEGSWRSARTDDAGYVDCGNRNRPCSPSSGGSVAGNISSGGGKHKPFFFGPTPSTRHGRGPAPAPKE